MALALRRCATRSWIEWSSYCDARTNSTSRAGLVRVRVRVEVRVRVRELDTQAARPDP